MVFSAVESDSRPVSGIKKLAIVNLLSMLSAGGAGEFEHFRFPCWPLEILEGGLLLRKKSLTFQTEPGNRIENAPAAGW